jgi:hypothetical protein
MWVEDAAHAGTFAPLRRTDNGVANLAGSGG